MLTPFPRIPPSSLHGCLSVIISPFNFRCLLKKILRHVLFTLTPGYWSHPRNIPKVMPWVSTVEKKIKVMSWPFLDKDFLLEKCDSCLASASSQRFAGGHHVKRRLNGSKPFYEQGCMYILSSKPRVRLKGRPDKCIATTSDPIRVYGLV